MISLLLAVTFMVESVSYTGVTYRLYYGPTSGAQTVFVNSTDEMAEVNDNELPFNTPMYFGAKRSKITIEI
jgi:hypothetical protein